MIMVMKCCMRSGCDSVPTVCPTRSVLTQTDLLIVTNRNFQLLSLPLWLKNNNSFIKCLWITNCHFFMAWQNTFLHRNYSTPAPHYPTAKLLDLLGFQPLHHISSVSLTNPDPIPTHHLHFPLLITIPTSIEPHIQLPLTLTPFRTKSSLS